jgi:hypothetical protein
VIPLLVGSLAAAQTPPPATPKSPPSHTDESIQQAVDAMYGKPIPTAAVCIERGVELDKVFTGSPVPVGVKRGAKGCVLVGVMVTGKLVEPAKAAPASLDPTAWGALDAAGKTAALGQWTDRVLLAFAQPDEKMPTQPKPTKAGIPVSRGYLRRDEPTWTTVHAIGTWTFAADGSFATEPAEKVDQTFKTETFTRPERVTGVTNEAVVSGLETRGAVIKECFQKAWNEDLDWTGRAVLEWKIDNGKTEGIALVNMPGDPPPNKTLANCEANAVNAISWPEGIRGSVVWVFAVLRDQVTATN